MCLVGAFWCSRRGRRRENTRTCPQGHGSGVWDVGNVFGGWGIAIVRGEGEGSCQTPSTLLCPHIPGGIHMEWFYSMNSTWIPYIFFIDTMQFQVDSIHFHMDSMHFHMDSMQFQVD